MNQPRDDILISQIIDGDATAGVWDELTALAGDDPAAWRRLADALRDHKAFARAVNAAVGLADTIELPRSDAATGPRPRSTPNLRFSGWSGWTGWAVAAVVTLALVTGFVNLLTTSPEPVTSGRAGLMETSAPRSAAELLQAYVDQGRQENRVIAEIPEKVLLETRPLPDGKGYELLYLRQILERKTVGDLYQVNSQDEMGRPASLVRYEGNQGPPM